MPDFMNADADFDDARVVLFGCPYDCTTSNRPGARFGPNAIREASYGLEAYSPYLHRELTEIAIHDMGDPELPMGGPERAFALIREWTDRIIAAGKTPFMLGGEHSVSIPVILRAAQQWKDMHVIHLDAHCDLRQDYLGEKNSHACVIRRVVDVIPPARVYQFGIRSGTREEFDFARQNQMLHKTTPDQAEAVLKKIGGAPVYVTVDLDVFDPSYFPGTGTPEPGGIDFNVFTDMLKVWKGKLNVVALDAVELAPKLDSSGISEALAAKVVREMLLAFC